MHKPKLFLHIYGWWPTEAETHNKFRSIHSYFQRGICSPFPCVPLVSSGAEEAAGPEC